MVYGNYFENNKKWNFSFITVKFGKILAASFPLNCVRIFGIKLCGVEVGKQVYIGPGFCLIMNNLRIKGRLVIGDRVSIAPHVTVVLDSNANWSKLNDFIKPIKGKVIIMNDTWIGTRSVVLPNIILNEMSVVAAGSIVTKDVNSYSIVAGEPAKEIRKIL